MKLFHKHNWKEIARTYQKSEVEVLRESGIMEVNGWRPSTNSYTIILWECTECKQTKKEVLNGKEI